MTIVIYSDDAIRRTSYTKRVFPPLNIIMMGESIHRYLSGKFETRTV